MQAKHRGFYLEDQPNDGDSAKPSTRRSIAARFKLLLSAAAIVALGFITWSMLQAQFVQSYAKFAAYQVETTSQVASLSVSTMTPESIERVLVAVA